MKCNFRLLSLLSLNTFILLSACHRPRTKSVPTTQDSTMVAVKKDAVAIPKTIETEEQKFTVSDIDFKYISAKSKVSFRSKDQTIDNANVNIRMKKDSIIWLSISAFGAEVAKGVILSDSIFFIDRYHKEYFKTDFASLSKSFNFNLSFGLIQSILVGNMPIPKKPNERFKKEKDFFMLRQEQGKVVVNNYIGEQNRRLKKLLVTEQPTKKSLTLDYEDFTQLNNFVFPYTSLIQLDYESEKDKQQYQTVFKIKHQKIELPEQLTFPFGIPANYKKKTE